MQNLIKQDGRNLQLRRVEQHLDVFVSKQVLHERTIESVHSGMMDRKSIRKKILQIMVFHLNIKQCTEIQVRKDLAQQKVYLFSLSSKNLRTCASLSHEDAKCIFFKTSITYCFRSLSSFFARMDKYKDLKRRF